MNVLRYSILALILWGLPSFFLAYFNPNLGAVASVASFGLLVIFYIFNGDRGPLLFGFIILGLSYFILGAFNYTGSLTMIDYATIIVKYIIVIICGGEILRRSTLQEIYIFLLIGSLSVIINTLFFPLHNAAFGPTYGRYSGFYLNPNSAGAISLFGFALSYGIKNSKLKYLGYIIFSVAGFFTFSRYFLGMWLFLNFLSVIISKKNLIFPAVGILFFGLIFLFSSDLQLDSKRFNAIEGIFNSDAGNARVLQEDSRTETWASYTDIILNKPIFGNGYDKLQGHHFGLFAGVHNTYLLVLGESGILPFLFLLYIYIYMLSKGYRSFKEVPHFSMLSISLFTALLVTHNYFDRYSLLFMSMYLYLVFSENLNFPVKELDTEGRNILRSVINQKSKLK